MYHHDERHPGDACDCRDISDEIEIELVIERRVDRRRRINEEERIPVRRCAHDRFSADIVAAAGPVLCDELLTEPLREPSSD